MRVYVSSRDAELGRSLEAEIEEHGWRVSRIAEACVVVHHCTADGVSDDVLRAKAGGAHLLLVGSCADLREHCGVADEIAITPLTPGEIGVRLDHLDRRRKAVTRELLLATAVEAAGDVIEITDPHAVVEYVNPAYTRVLGIEASEAIGKTPAQLTRSDAHSKEFFQDIDRTLTAGNVWKGVIISRAPDGRLVHFETTLSPVFDGDGNMTHHVGVKRDVTQRVRAEQEVRRVHAELIATRDEALAANRAKSQFLANMSHELRTPLNAIIGYSEMLAEEAVDLGEEEFVSDLDKIRGAGKHLLALIDDVLDLSKIEAGKMDLYLERFEVRGVVDEMTATLRPLFDENGNTLAVEVADVPPMRADHTKLRQTLLNLLSNANKFTERGTVWLRAYTEAGFVVFEVTDSGIGMSQAQVDKLFEAFVQADANTTRKYGGTGLGLAISQRFCEMMGGTIEVTSELGRGSTFTVRLPLEVADPASPGARASHGPADAEHTVLVVDDDPTVHELLGRSLTRQGLRVECVSRGADAIAVAREIVPSVVVLDVLMPGMDGWAVLKELKADATTQQIPVVLHTVSHQREVGFALGAVDYVIKPVEPSTLVRVVTGHLGSAGPILVVEDDPASRELMSRALATAGHQVVEAENGRVAIQLLAAETPQLIVLDLMMPEVDGFGVLEHLRITKRLRDVPVVVVTAKSLTEEERRFLAGAAKRVIEKHAHPLEELLAVVGQRVAEVLNA